MIGIQIILKLQHDLSILKHGHPVYLGSCKSFSMNGTRGFSTERKPLFTYVYIYIYVRETFLYYVTQLACSRLERIPRISNSPSFSLFSSCV